MTKQRLSIFMITVPLFNGPKYPVPLRPLSRGLAVTISMIYTNTDKKSYVLSEFVFIYTFTWPTKWRGDMQFCVGSSSPAHLIHVSTACGEDTDEGGSILLPPAFSPEYETTSSPFGCALKLLGAYLWICMAHSGVSICKRSFDQLIIIREYENTNNKTLTVFILFQFQSSSVFLAHTKIAKNIYTFSDCTQFC